MNILKSIKISKKEKKKNHSLTWRYNEHAHEMQRVSVLGGWAISIEVVSEHE